MLKHFVAIFLVISNLTCAFGVNIATGNYQIFDNYHLGVDATSIRFFKQDSNGLMWIGTDKGLFSFDGYRAYPHYKVGEEPNNTINSGIFISDVDLLLGYENGFLHYNTKTKQYSSFLPDFNHDVRSLVKIEHEIWIGCFDGLFIYDTETKELSELLTGPQNRSKHSMIYALLVVDGYVYLGSNGKLGRFSLNNKKYETIDDPGVGGNFLIHSLLFDSQRKCIWMGKGGALFQYFTDSGIVKYVDQFNVVKSMALDADNNLVMGTDNGLRIYKEGVSKNIVHDSRESNSLANNVVSCVYKDASDNLWLGTDNGISLWPNNRRFNTIPIYHITGSSEGNQFRSLYRDSNNNFWLGGSNGLIVTSAITSPASDMHWYKMGRRQNRISHNQIRDIFEDKDKNVWVATDYGINRYNEETQNFSRYAIYSTDGNFNANWAYDILEDSLDRLWVASYNGGIFVIEKSKLFANNMAQTADIHYSIRNGLSGNNVDFLVADRNHNIWALIHNTGIDVINMDNGEVANFPIQQYTNGAIPNNLINDSQGNIWAGFSNGIAKINPKTENVKNINFDGLGNAEVLCMTEVDQTIWISTTNGIWIVDKEKLSVQHTSTVDQVFTSMYYDETLNEVLLGGIDRVALSNAYQPVTQKAEKLIISAIYVNDQSYRTISPNNKENHTDKIKLSHHQNNITLEISDLVYAQENRGTFVYKIGDSENWIPLPSGENKIQLNKLDPGTYPLTIGKISYDTSKGEALKQFTITIAPPWYATLLAKAVYFMLLVLFIWWVYIFITAKNRMKYERLEKEKTLEQSKLKIAFFSDVAHEFKTPLSLIIAPLNGLIQGIKNDKDKNALEMIQQNAMKLNSLIHQAIDYYRDDSKVNIGLLLSKVELVSFARTIFSSYKEGMKHNKIEFIFNTNVDQVYVNIDTVKMESVFNNLLSNACKFTQAGGSIIFSIHNKPQESAVEIKVSDTGAGIPKQDVPYVFQRFFQSNANPKNHEGTGIGLFLVKNYIELHGGEVSAFSEFGEGSTFSIYLPIMMPELEVERVAQKSSDVNTGKQLILIVEDNLAIAEFIYNTFISDYRCVIANNGKTGLKACLELNPDLIITDLMMPVMDGIEMARRLKENAITSSIPLVFLTAKDDKETELKSIQLNIDAFIAKPFDSNILFSRINQILENRKMLEKKVRIEQLSTPKIEKVESLDEKFLAKITKIIEDKIADPSLNVNMLCELAGVSSKQLYRKVKQLTGLTTIDYIKSIRMKKAAMYLSNKNFTIAEVMYMVGFSNHSYFAKCFQAKFGVTPRQFIEEKKDA